MNLAQAARVASFSFSGWLVFFSAIAGLSATLFSVMFVTFQLRSALWNGSRSRRAIATSALGELMLPLFASLILIMANHPWRAAAWTAGGFGIAVIGWHWRSFILDHDTADEFDQRQAKTSWFSFAIYVTVFIAGFLSPRSGIEILAGISIWLLFSGASESWLLLTHEAYSKDAKKKFFVEFQKWAGPITRDLSTRIRAVRFRPSR